MKRLIKSLAFSLLLLAASSTVNAQSVGINSDNSAADASALLDVKSTTQGVLIPRMDKSQRDAIASPATGLMIFQTDNTPGFYYNAGTPSVKNWQAVGGSSNAGAQLALQATKTTGSQTLPNSNGSGSGSQLTGDLVTYNNTTVTVPTIGTYDNNGTFTVVQAGLYFVQGVTRVVDNATPTNTINQFLYVSIDNGDPLSINSFHGMYSGATNQQYPAGVKGKGYVSGMYYLTAGQTICIKGWSGNTSTPGTTLKTDGSCQFMIVKL